MTLRYWRVGTRPTERNDDWWSPMRSGSFVAVGFPLGEDLRGLLAQPPELIARIKRIYPDSGQTYVRVTLAAWVNEVARGDIVVAADGTRMLGIGRVTSEYEHDERNDGAPPDRRRVIWLHLGDWQAPLWGTRKFPEGYRRTLFELRQPVTLAAINARIQR